MHIVTVGDEEYCWFCGGELCYDCWEDIGHCGHVEAVEQDECAREFHREKKCVGCKAHIGKGMPPIRTAQ